MKEQFENAIELIKTDFNVNGCITGSVMLDFFPDGDIDIFVYSIADLNKALFYMYHNSKFQVLDSLEQYKLKQYLDDGKSSLDSIGLATFKQYYNVSVPINVTYRKNTKDLFSVISNFDLDGIAQGYDLKVKKSLSLRESSGMELTYNKWNPAFWKADQWSCKRLLRQFSRIEKYEKRGYNCETVTDKYIELVEQQLKNTNIYKTERGTEFYEKTKKEFELVLSILQAYKKERKISNESLMILKTII